MKTIFTIYTLLLFLIIPVLSCAQFVTVTGYVTNVANGKALENVSIFEQNQEIGTITNQNGFYRLVLEKGNYSLRITDSGFKPYTQSLELNADTTLIVKLQPKMNAKNKGKKSVDLHADGKNDKKAATRNFKLF